MTKENMLSQQQPLIHNAADTTFTVPNLTATTYTVCGLGTDACTSLLWQPAVSCCLLFIVCCCNLKLVALNQVTVTMQ